jgi:hypothetical protein
MTKSFASGLGASVLALSVGVAAVACSSSSSASVSASQASTDVGTALCTKINSCSAYFEDVTWGDVATCGSRTAASLANVLAASGSGWTPSSVDACAKAVAGTACNDALGNNLPAACHAPAGQITTGMPCGDSSQCESAYCNTGTGVCGTCAAARGAVGSPCYRDDDCVYGVVCTGAATTTSPATAGTCTQLVASGADCDTQHPCERSLACKSGMCASPDEAGQPCTTGTCDTLAGLYCKGAVGNGAGTCTAVALAATGAPCGVVNDAIAQCSGGGNCALANATSGTCQAPIADGMPCDATKGPGCTSPAVCTGGVCTVPNPANCH